MQQERLYAATLTVTGTLRPHPDGKRGTITLDDDTMITVKIRAFQRKKLTPEVLSQRLEFHLWPRTDKSGFITSNTQLYKWKEANESTNRFHITGRLVRRKKDLSRAVVLIRRNQQGNLTREFTLEANLSSDVVKSLPRALPPGVKEKYGVTLEGFVINGFLVAVTIDRTRLRTPKPLKERRDANMPWRAPNYRGRNAA